MNLNFNKIIILAFLLITGCSTSELFFNNTAPKYSEINSKTNKPFEQTNKSLEFYKYISGVNSVIVTTDQAVNSAFDNDSLFFKKYYTVMKNYFTSVGFKNIAITNDEREWIDANIPLVNTVNFNLKLDNTENFISSMIITFKTCNGDQFRFKTNSDYLIDHNWDKFLFNTMKEMYWCKVDFNPKNSIVLKREMTKWDLQNMKQYLSNNECDDLEGIYEKYGVSDIEKEIKYKIAVKKEGDLYKIIYLSGAEKTNNWKEGELKGTFSKTSIKDFYKVNWKMIDKSLNYNVYLNTSTYNFLELSFLDVENGYKIKYLKMYPQYSEKIVSSQNYSSSGTGFFVTKNGELITNHHVIKDAKKIIVQTDSSNLNKEYEAEIIFDDKTNDLTLLKIKDSNFKLSSDIPFQIYKTDLPLGTSVFTLGYPLIETMGEAIKLSDGIISSDYGYMSNNSSYQVTVPINPGNSGGPLFDKKGHLVGVINAKYTGAENVTYAIKSSVLANLLQKNNIKNNNSNKELLNNQNFVQQIKVLNSLVCLIKVYN